MQHFEEKLHLYSEDLIKAAVKGRSSAQREIYEKLAPKMMAVCLRYMGDRESAEDILQDGFVTLFNKLDMYSGEGSFEGWARRIFVNTALMSLRKTDALKLSDDISAAAEIVNNSPSATQNLGYKELMALVASLPSGYRTVFNLAVVEGFNHAEIAKMLGISEATSRSQLNRARTMLQKKILNSK